MSPGASNAMTNTSASPTQLQAETQALLNGPAGTPPIGMLPTFDDSPYMNALVAFSLCLASATLLVLMRTYTKLFILRSRAYEDCESHGAHHCITTKLMHFRFYRARMGKSSKASHSPRSITTHPLSWPRLASAYLPYSQSSTVVVIICGKYN